jgi:protocatechuate 3,4-dioxygenase beta subunit
MVKLLCALPRLSRFAVLALFAPGFCLAGLPSSGAQTSNDTASISGTVVDLTGAPIPGAKVALTNLSTGHMTTTSADDKGAYTLSDVPLGPASITVSSPGFNSSGTISISVKAGETILKPVTLIATLGAAVSVGVVQNGDEPGSSSGAAQSYVTVSSNAVAGPMGYAATPTIAGATQSQSAQQQAFFAGQQFNYPSIIFYISAAPLVNLPTTNETSNIQAAQETDRNPVWLDASFTLSLYDSNGNPLPNACSDGSVQVLGLMPQQTVAALKNSAIADAASAANDVAGALATFYPGTSGEVSAATKAMNIVFQDIFPPRPVAYEYSNMTDNCNFGWYFRPNTTASGTIGQSSILGIQTGIVLLKTSKIIASIKVNGRSLSAWNNAPTADKDKDKDKRNKLFLVSDRPIGTISLPTTANIDYDNITSLAMFPSLIQKTQAMKILHIDKDADFVAFATANKLVGTNATFDYITNKSLDTFLGLASPSPPDAHPGSGSTPDSKAKDTSTSPAAPAPKGPTTAAQPSTPTTTGKQPSPHPKTPGTPKPAPLKPQS